MTDRTTSEVILSASGLQKTFVVGFRRRKVVALTDATFDVRKGEIVGLIGPNGAGKTTALKILMGLVVADAGTATLFGESVRNVAARARIGYLPEGPYFYEHLRAPELLRFYGQLFGIDRKTLELRIEELIERVGLGHAKNRPIRKFSKGMRQRAGIAQALINDPELVILDEPQSGLDPTGRKEVRDLIAELRDKGKTVMFSSHILPDVEAVCDRVIVMSQGKVVEQGTLSELATDQVAAWEVIVGKFDLDPTKFPTLLSHEVRGEQLLLRFDGGAAVEEIVTQLVAASARLVSVTPERTNLEQIYLRET